jgi:hypothetical protein
MKLGHVDKKELGEDLHIYLPPFQRIYDFSQNKSPTAFGLREIYSAKNRKSSETAEDICCKPLFLTRLSFDLT